jgi:hypothetical protein
LELFRHNGIFSPLIYKWLLRPLFFQCYKAYQKCEVSTKLDIYRSCLLVNYRGLCECCPFLCYFGFFYLCALLNMCCNVYHECDTMFPLIAIQPLS